MLPQNDAFFLDKPEPNRSCLLALRSLILQQDENISETKKYGMPCFCYKNKMFCYLWTDKKNEEPYILFVEGQKLYFPELEAGNRTRMKIFRVNPAQDLPLKTIQKLLAAAIKIYAQP